MLIKISGIITSKDIHDINDILFSKKEFLTWKYQLWLFENIKDVLISGNEVRLIAKRDQANYAKNPKLKVGIVSDSMLAYGYARMYETFLGDEYWETSTFKNLDEAADWLKQFQK